MKEDNRGKCMIRFMAVVEKRNGVLLEGNVLHLTYR